MFEGWFQDLLKEIYQDYPNDALLPGFELEYEENPDGGFDCENEAMKTFMKPTGLEIRCLECLASRDGALKSWSLREMENSKDELDDERLRFKMHLEEQRRRKRIGMRLAKIAQLER